jgi:hypothetical protein
MAGSGGEIALTVGAVPLAHHAVGRCGPSDVRAGRRELLCVPSPPPHHPIAKLSSPTPPNAFLTVTTYREIAALTAVLDRARVLRLDAVTHEGHACHKR